MGVVQQAAEHQRGLFLEGVPELIDASAGADDGLEHAPACLELIGVLEENEDVLPSDEVARHRQVGPAGVDRALLAENFCCELR